MTFPGDDTLIVGEVTRAARESVGSGTGRPLVVGYHPVARLNPFQELLYSSAGEAGARAVPIIEFSDLRTLETAVRMGIPTVLHLHWTEGALKDAVGAEDAERRAREYLDDLRRLKDLGVCIVWTVHNVLPHLSRYPDAEARLRADLAALADGIHTMNPNTIDEVSPFYPLPADRVFQIPHPSYVGFYPEVSRSSARFALGLGPDDVVVGSIGSIQRYKGLTSLAGAVRRASVTTPRVRGFIGGIPGRDSADLVAELTRSPSVKIIAKRLSDREISQAMTAIDFMALPYVRALNSGAAALAATFGVPIIAPDTSTFRTMLDAGLGVGFDPDDTEGFEQAVVEAASGGISIDDDVVAAYLSEIHPLAVSRSFFEAVRQVAYRGR